MAWCASCVQLQRVHVSSPLLRWHRVCWCGLRSGWWCRLPVSQPTGRKCRPRLGLNPVALLPLFAQVVHNTDLVVGDVLLVNMGDKVVADGIMIDGFHLVVDEASLTGVAGLNADGICVSVLALTCGSPTDASMQPAGRALTEGLCACLAWCVVLLV